MIPTVGRIVHYTEEIDVQGELAPPCAAIITAAVKGSREPAPDDEEHKYAVTLHIYRPNGSFFVEDDVKWAAEPKRGHWNWPPRV